jgi:hypothetical protein
METALNNKKNIREGIVDVTRQNIILSKNSGDNTCKFHTEKILQEKKSQ